MNRMAKVTLGVVVGMAVVVGLGNKITGQEAGATTSRRPKAIRPQWTPGLTINKANWNYTGPVKAIYTKENAPAAPKLEELPLVASVMQYGITWTFERPARVGKFITGDSYVVGPVTVVGITPKPLFGKEVVDHGDWELIEKQGVKESVYKDKWARNGSVLNQPVTGKYAKHGGFDSRLAHKMYDPSQFARLPIAMKPGDSLISTISAKDHAKFKYDGHGQPVLAAAVLTCMAAPQPADAFRPSYCDKGNKVYLARNLHRELLHRLPKPAEAPKTVSEFARLFQRPWLDTVAWGYANPELNSPRYGQRITNSVSTVALLLHLDYPVAEKEPLLVHYVQYGIDLWGIVRAGFGGWQGHGGFSGGRKWTLIFSGMMLGDEAMRSPNSAYPKVVFGEDTQTADGRSWSGFDVVFTSHPAWTNAKTASPELEHPNKWVEIRAGNRYRRGNQSEAYRRCCTSIEWPGQTLAARIMRAETYWNHDPFFRYVDRWMEGEDIHATAKVVIEAARLAAEKAKPGSTAAGYKSGSAWYLKQERTNPFFQAMWTKYRKNLPPAKLPSAAKP